MNLARGNVSPDAADPRWFSPALYAGATVTKKGRSAADEQGRFTAQMLFALADGATLADCTDPLTQALADLVPRLEREEKDGRVTLKGDAKDGYQAVCVCGEVKGKMTAFVSYRWTVPPPVAPSSTTPPPTPPPT